MAEHSLSPADLIWPLFIAEGEGAEEPISTLHGVSRWSVDRLAERAREIGAQILAGPSTQPWQTREVMLADPDGYRLTFTKPLPPRPASNNHRRRRTSRA